MKKTEVQSSAWFWIECGIGMWNIFLVLVSSKVLSGPKNSPTFVNGLKENIFQQRSKCWISNFLCLFIFFKVIFIFKSAVGSLAGFSAAVTAPTTMSLLPTTTKKTTTTTTTKKAPIRKNPCPAHPRYNIVLISCSALIVFKINVWYPICVRKSCTVAVRPRKWSGGTVHSEKRHVKGMLL